MCPGGGGGGGGWPLPGSATEGTSLFYTSMQLLYIFVGFNLWVVLGPVLGVLGFVLMLLAFGLLLWIMKCRTGRREEGEEHGRGQGGKSNKEGSKMKATDITPMVIEEIPLEAVQELKLYLILRMALLYFPTRQL